jgi:hypothetical protein
MDVYKGIFNVSMLVTDQYGRSSVSPNLYRVSAAGDLYTFQSYAGLSRESRARIFIQSHICCLFFSHLKCMAKYRQYPRWYNADHQWRGFL